MKHTYKNIKRPIVCLGAPFSEYKKPNTRKQMLEYQTT